MRESQKRVSCSVVKTVIGEDSDELLLDLLRTYAHRDLVNFHRSVLQGDNSSVAALLSHDEAHYANSTLLPISTANAVNKCSKLHHEDFTRLHSAITLQVIEDYPVVEQITDGSDGEPNELYPRGELKEPERNLDSVYFTPLLRACQVANLDMVRLLLRHGAEVDYHTPSYNNAIHVLLHTHLDEPEAVSEILKLITTDQNKNETSFTYAVLASSSPQPLVLTTMLELGYPVHPEIKMDMSILEGWVDITLMDVLVTHL